MRRQLFPALRMVLVLTVLWGLLYPLVMTGIAQAAFADKADGSLVERNGRWSVPRSWASLRRPRVLPHSTFGRRALASGSLVHDTDADGNSPATQTPPTRRPVPAPAGRPTWAPPTPTSSPPSRSATVAYRGVNGLADDARCPIDAVTASRVGRRPPHLRRQRPAPGATRRTSAASRSTRCSRSSTTTLEPIARVPRRGGRQRAASSTSALDALN